MYQRMIGAVAGKFMAEAGELGDGKKRRYPGES